jgi:hypothetical protein
MIAAGGLLVAGGAIVAALAGRIGGHDEDSLVAALNVGALQIMLTGRTFSTRTSPPRERSTRSSARRRRFRKGPPFYSVGMLDQSIPFTWGGP